MGGLYSAVGGTINHIAFLQSEWEPATITALDEHGNVLESYGLSGETAISTPNALNAGAFRGIARAQADIRYFEVSNSGIVMHDIMLSQSLGEPVPEAQTYVPLVMAIVVMLLVPKK